MNEYTMSIKLWSTYGRIVRRSVLNGLEGEGKDGLYGIGIEQRIDYTMIGTIMNQRDFKELVVSEQRFSSVPTTIQNNGLRDNVGGSSCCGWEGKGRLFPFPHQYGWQRKRRRAARIPCHILQIQFTIPRISSQLYGYVLSLPPRGTLRVHK